jgi:uncharacterized protein (DUF983 family)
MNIDLEGMLGTFELNHSNRNRLAIRVSGKRCPQCDDGEVLDIKDRLCKICGEELIAITEASDSNTSGPIPVNKK